MHGSVQIPQRDQVIARDLSKPAATGLVVGLIGIAATAGLGYGAGDHFSHFGHSMLVATMFFLSICLGALFFTLLQHVTSAGWSVVVRRVAESMTGALMFLFPIVLLLIALQSVDEQGA